MNEKEQSNIKKEFAPDSTGHVIEAKYFYFDPSERRLAQTSIMCGGHEKCASDFRIDRPRFPFYALVFIAKGKGYYTCDNHKYKLQYGSLIIMKPDMPYILEADRENPMEQFLVICHGEKSRKLIEKNKLSSKHVINIARPEITSMLFKEILETGFQKPEFAAKVCSNYLECIVLKEIRENTQPETTDSSYQSFLNCKQYLEENFIKINSCTELAQQCSFDIRYIARLFKKYQNTRPYDYLMKLKTDKALNLLLTSDLSIKRIAFMIGFSDPYHFSRIFKKRFKLSPSEYRENLTI